MNTVRPRHGVNVAQFVISAVLSLLAGALLCTAYLMFKPVPVLTGPPKEKEANSLYYLEGRKGYGANGWMLKREAFLRGQTISLTEEEANGWLESLYPAARDGGKDEAAPLLQAGTPNVRLAGDRTMLGSVFVVDLFGWKPKIVAQSRGHFAVKGGVNRFQPETVHIGSFPAHRIPLIQTLALNRVMGMWKYPEDLSAAWEKLGTVKVEKNALVLEGAGS